MIAYADRLTRCGRDGGLEAAPLRDFGHPAFPAPSDGRKILAKLGRIAPRDQSGALFDFSIRLFENWSPVKNSEAIDPSL